MGSHVPSATMTRRVTYGRGAITVALSRQLGPLERAEHANLNEVIARASSATGIAFVHDGLGLFTEGMIVLDRRAIREMDNTPRDNRHVLLHEITALRVGREAGCPTAPWPTSGASASTSRAIRRSR